MIPQYLQNIEVKFAEPGCYLGFKCKAEGIGKFVVNIYEDGQSFTPEIAFILGDDVGHPINVVNNSRSLPHPMLENIYHMARCRREMDRLGPTDWRVTDYNKGYIYHRDLFLAEWKQLMNERGGWLAG